MRLVTIYLDDAAVRRLLRLPELLGGMRKVLMDLSAGKVIQPLRSVMEIPAEQGLLFIKPALMQGALATKLIVVFLTFTLFLGIMTAMAGSSRTLYEGGRDG